MAALHAGPDHRLQLVDPAEFDDVEKGRRGRCLADSLIRKEPATDDLEARDKLTTTAVNLRRLTWQLIDIKLPIIPYWEVEGGLAFDLPSSATSGEKIIIGHANGVITIDLDESLDEYREHLRASLNEPYRTMLGHFRHEVGHYYQSQLVESEPGAEKYLAECRALFGDEQASYADALTRHYDTGAPQGWRTNFISEYATMHPWEDFAECFAHYLHITDTIDTCREAGMVLRRGEDAVHRAGRRHCAAGELRRRPGVVDAPRLEVDVVVLQPREHLDGQGPALPVRVAGSGYRQARFIHRVVRDTARPPSPDPSTTRSSHGRRPHSHAALRRDPSSSR